MVLFTFLRAPHDAAYCLLTHHWHVHEIIFPPYLAYIQRNSLGMDVNNLKSILVQVMTCHRQTAYSNKLKQPEQDILNPSAEILVIWLFYYSAPPLIPTPPQPPPPQPPPTPPPTLVPYTCICIGRSTGSALIQVMASRLFGAKPLPEAVLS